MWVCQCHFYSLSLFLSSSFLKHCWPATFYARFFCLKQKKSEEKARQQRVNTYKYVLSFTVSLFIEFFFLLVLFSHVSMIIQGGTNTPVHCGYYCRPSATVKKKKSGKKNQRWTWHFVQDAWTKERNELCYNRHLFCQLSQN